MNRPFLFAIRIYQLFISPVLAGLGGKCRFNPSCSAYAAEAFTNNSPMKAFVMTIKRLSKCHPFHSGA